MLEYLQIIRKSTFFKLAVAFGISYIMYLSAAFFLPLLLAIALSFALFPLVDFISRLTVKGTFHIPRVVAIILALISFGGFIFLTAVLLLLPLFGQINELLQKLPDLLARSSNVVDLESVLNDPSKIPFLPSDLNMLLDNALSWATAFVINTVRNLMRSSLETVKSLIGLIVVPFLAFYLLKDWRELRAMVINLFNYADQPKAAHVLDEIGHTLSAYVNGLAKLSLLAGCVISLGNFILGVDYPLVLGFWAILAETIPVVGPLMGAIPAIFIAYGNSPETALLVGCFYGIYYQLDANVIMPRLMGKEIDLHPVALILALLIGAKLFGIIGMIFAVPVAAVYRVLYKELWHAGEQRPQELGG